MVNRGRFFTAIIPEGEPVKVYLSDQGLFHKVYRDPKGVYQKDGVFTGSLNLYNPQLFPAFIYSVAIGGNRVQPLKGSLLDYPPEPLYSRKGNKLTVAPHKYRFEPGWVVSLNLIGKEGRGEPLWSGSGKGGLEIPEKTWVVALGSRAWEICFDSADFSYLLEQFPYPAAGHRMKGVFTGNPAPYLSVKDLLDPVDGLQRLIEFIKVNRSLPGVVSAEKMGKLLSIIRSATFSDEEKILKGLYLEDREFFEEVTDRMLTEHLIFFMDKKEVAKLLFEVPDHLFVSVFGMAPEVRDMFLSLVSRNRREDILHFNHTQKNRIEDKGVEPLSGSGSVPVEKNGLWSWVEAWYRNKRGRTIFIPQDSCQGFNLEYRNEPGHKGYVCQKGVFQVVCSGNGEVLISVMVAMQRAQVYFEVKEFALEEILFQDLPVGVYSFRFSTGLPRRIMLGGVGFNGELYEGLCLKVS